jgi:hypothetical protein
VPGKNSQQSSGFSAQPQVFRLWWGLLGCAALMVAILLAAPYGDNIHFLPDRGGAWYYWKLPDPTALTRVSAWVSYAAHQLAIWWLIYSAQSQKLNYTGGLHRVNLWALAVNGGFVLWHIAQTRLSYDGLAQDVHIISSLGSVAIMLMLVIIMENQRRGVVLGRKWHWLDEPGRFLRKYHGYYFSWAIIYTFWYHPIETSLGHLLGTFYILMLLLQGSLFYTRSHVNRYWTGLLEVFVLLHGAVVAWLSLENHSWGQFLFGFGAIFVICQMHGLGLGARSRWLVFAGFLLAVAGYYGSDLVRAAAEVSRIPLIYFLGIPLLAALLKLLSKLPTFSNHP